MFRLECCLVLNGRVFAPTKLVLITKIASVIVLNAFASSSNIYICPDDFLMVKTFIYSIATLLVAITS